MGHIGIVYGEATTDSFSFVFSPSYVKGMNLKNAFVVVEGDNFKHKVIGKVVDIVTDNPMLSVENLKFFVDDVIGREVGEFLKSDRFVSFQAKCEVIGEFDENEKRIKSLEKPVETGSKVFLIDKELLEEIFFEGKPEWLFPGFIKQEESARFSLNGDHLLTMHCGVFGMTGMGKTNTSTTLLEELTFRGAKSIVFDPHGDYENFGILRKDLFDAVERVIPDAPALRSLVEQYRNFLSKAWEGLEEKVPSVLKEKVKEEKSRELENSSVYLRLAMFRSLLEREVVPSSSPTKFAESLREFAEKYNFEEICKRIPQSLLGRLLKLVVKGFPSLKLNEFFDKTFVMELIEAYSGEEISEAQGLYYLKWLEQVEMLSLTDKEKKRDKELLKFLRLEENRLDNTNRSKWPIRRQLLKVEKLLASLRRAGLIPVDSVEFIEEFSSKTGSLSLVSNLIFDLTEVSPETMQRALLYSVAYAGFHLHKSKKLSFHKGDSPILFVIEEARVLIPSSGAEELSHPASRFARNIVRRIATEGRKMGLGLLIISQKPSSVDPLPVSQCNTLVLHRVINPEDLSFVKSVGEAISEEDIEMLKTVEKGVSIVSGTALKLRKSLLVKFRERLSAEGREHPRPLQRVWSS
ncbi:ATP-binding protein [Phorcysia thermohydrogeniphila]|uniref:Uncharacterized protein DUF87 n=1 Tax=Phorcysia thermohydrogeniphila TaxID=936138 RepID=A0A4R1GBX7_9BACT|nr:ATP-binding protein [Phorcysia thermohydrogeniphila]TCK05308.1 uncharacterized protein DUF87 [Phorcysia thermohydrogeniphila]